VNTPRTGSLRASVALSERSEHQPRLLAGRRVRHVGRQDVVAAADRYAVAGEKEERGVARSELPRHLVELVDQRLPVEVLAAQDLEAEPLDRTAHRACIVDRPLQLLVRGKVLIPIIADHQGDALVGDRCRHSEQDRRDGNDDGSSVAHEGCPWSPQDYRIARKL
jgi:hypothetical protein